MWPAELVEGVLKDGHRLVVPTPIVKLRLVAVMALAGIEACTFTWKSWLWQRAMLLRASALRPRVRMVVSNNTVIEPVIQTMARQAFWQLDKATIEDMMEWSGMPLSECTTLFDAAFDGAKKALGITDEAALEVLRSRFAKLACHIEYVDDLMEVDEAAQCLDEADRKELRRLQERTHAHEGERKDFAKSFRERRERVVASHVQKSGNKRARVSAAAQGYRGPKTLPGAETLLQRDLRLSCPPGGYIWVARRISAWCTRLPPFRTTTKYWRREGSESAAAKVALSDLWCKYLGSNGLAHTECPISGLLGGGGASPSAVGPSGSRSSTG